MSGKKRENGQSSPTGSKPALDQTVSFSAGNGNREIANDCITFPWSERRKEAIALTSRRRRISSSRAA
jgi:hypothetical protein